ncbi:MAG: hypothetical protein Q7S55_03400 [Nanoarchaeota archaeon]|nr:hypothetical protein [Nanoarchaeota archaeon]
MTKDTRKRSDTVELISPLYVNPQGTGVSQGNYRGGTQLLPPRDTVKLENPYWVFPGNPKDIMSTFLQEGSYDLAPINKIALGRYKLQLRDDITHVSSNLVLYHPDHGVKLVKPCLDYLQQFHPKAAPVGPQFRFPDCSVRIPEQAYHKARNVLLELRRDQLDFYCQNTYRTLEELANDPVWRALEIPEVFTRSMVMPSQETEMGTPIIFRHYEGPAMSLMSMQPAWSNNGLSAVQYDEGNGNIALVGTERSFRRTAQL